MAVPSYVTVDSSPLVDLTERDGGRVGLCPVTSFVEVVGEGRLRPGLDRLLRPED